MSNLVIDEIIDSHTIVVEGVTYAAHHDPDSCCGMGIDTETVCAFYERIESCHTIPCLATQMRRLGNNDRKDVIWLEKA